MQIRIGLLDRGGLSLMTQVLPLRERPRLFRLGSDRVRASAVAGERRPQHLLASCSSLLLIKIRHVYQHVARGTNTIERLSRPWFLRHTHEPVAACLSALAPDAERTWIAVRIGGDDARTVLQPVMRDGQLRAETMWVGWLVLVIGAEPRDAARQAPSRSQDLQLMESDTSLTY